MKDTVICYICEDAQAITFDENCRPRCEKCAKMPEDIADMSNLLTGIGIEYRRTPEYIAEQQKRKKERRQEAVLAGVCVVAGLWLAVALIVGNIHMAQYVLRFGR